MWDESTITPNIFKIENPDDTVGECYSESIQRFSRPFARPSVALIKEKVHYGQRVRDPHRGKTAFVRQTTPHFGGTSREGLYSVRAYHTPWKVKSKYLFEKYRYFFIEMCEDHFGRYFCREMDLDCSCNSRRSVMMELDSRKPSAVRCHRPSVPRSA